MRWLRDRLEEPSTWGSLGGVLLLAAEIIEKNQAALAAGDYVNVAFSVLAALAFAKGIIKREPGKYNK